MRGTQAQISQAITLILKSIKKIPGQTHLGEVNQSHHRQQNDHGNGEWEIVKGNNSSNKKLKPDLWEEIELEGSHQNGQIIGQRHLQNQTRQFYNVDFIFKFSKRSCWIKGSAEDKRRFKSLLSYCMYRWLYVENDSNTKEELLEMLIDVKNQQNQQQQQQKQQEQQQQYLQETQEQDQQQRQQEHQQEAEQEQQQHQQQEQPPKQRKHQQLTFPMRLETVIKNPTKEYTFDFLRLVRTETRYESEIYRYHPQDIIHRNQAIKKSDGNLQRKAMLKMSNKRIGSRFLLKTSTGKDDMATFLTTQSNTKHQLDDEERKALLSGYHDIEGHYSIPLELSDTHYLGSICKVTDRFYEDPDDKNICAKYTSQEELYNARGFLQEKTTSLTVSHKEVDVMLGHEDWVPEDVAKLHSFALVKILRSTMKFFANQQIQLS